MVRPSHRRAAAQHAVEAQCTTITHACDTFAINDTCYR
jgi:hypothetical protein